MRVNVKSKQNDMIMLTIGMIVKNEEKVLRRCLTSLQPLMNEIRCELIIADTGSTDSTVEIAKEFMDLEEGDKLIITGGFPNTDENRTTNLMKIEVID